METLGGETLAHLIDRSSPRLPAAQVALLGVQLCLAPEQARGGGVDAAADVWGIGAVLWEAAAGQRAFGAGAEVDRDGYPQLVRPATLLGRLRRAPGTFTRAIDACPPAVRLSGMTRMKVGPKGQVVIPKPVRDELDIQPGDEVLVDAVDGEARVRRPRSKRLLGLLADPCGPQGMEQFEADKRRELELEERKAERWLVD
jgi:AbrB family looped-hinge helix DNA binding protein